MSRSFNRELAGAVCLALIAAQTPARAQSAAAEPTGATELEEVVVTAARQGGQSLQEVPLAIQVFSGAELERRQVREMADLVKSIPSASEGEQVGSVIRTFTLRGVGAAGGIGDSPTGYYIDNVPFAVPNFPLAPPIRMTDLDRVEVLRGPQGTLYGQGSAGGTIIFHTQDPSLDHLTGRADLAMGTTADASDPNYNVAGAISVPLIEDKLALRLSGGYDKRGGYVDVYSGLPTGKPFAKDANEITNKDIRGVVLWKPNDDLTVRAQAWHFEPSQDFTQSINSIDPPQQWFNGDTRGYESGKFDLYSLGIDYDLGFGVLTSSTSYLDGKFGYLTGSYFGPFLGQGTLSNDYIAHSAAQEFQLRSNSSGPLHWLAGAFYQNASAAFLFDVVTAPLQADGNNKTSTENYSVFGEVSYDLMGGKLVPLVGIRYYSDDRELISRQTFNGTSAADSGSAEPEKTTWRLNLSYKPTDDLTAFATVSTGFRVGITQTALSVFALSLDGIEAKQGLDPDSLTNYEFGLKSRLADRRVQLGLNLYHIDFKDVQLGLSTTAGIAAFANVGDAKSTGVDLEVQWETPIEGLSIAAMGNWNDSEFGKILPEVSATIPAISKGERLTNTTEYNYRLDVGYSRPVGNNFTLVSHASASTTSSRIMPDGYEVDSYSLYDASIGLSKNQWEATLFGENLADERGPAFVRNQILSAGPFPRTLGLRLRFNFD